METHTMLPENNCPMLKQGKCPLSLKAEMPKPKVSIEKYEQLQADLNEAIEGLRLMDITEKQLQAKLAALQWKRVSEELPKRRTESNPYSSHVACLDIRTGHWQKDQYITNEKVWSSGRTNYTHWRPIPTLPDEDEAKDE